MNLEELLDHVATHVLDDRANLVEGPADELWPEALLVRYFNDAQRIFCRKAWLIVDDTTAACSRITLVEDTDTYTLHSSVVRVLSVTPADTLIPLMALNFKLISPTPLSLPDYYAVPPLPMTEQPGRPGWYSTDQATRKLRIRPAPNAAAVSDIGTLNLRVARMPITALTTDDLQASPEIPEEYHLDLCDYVAGKALSQANVDSADTRKEGREMIAEFYAKLRAARNDRLIAQSQPGQYVFGGWARTARV